MKQYVQTDLEVDRQVGNTLAQLIIGGLLASIEIADETAARAKALLELTPDPDRRQRQRPRTGSGAPSRPT